MSEVPLCRMIRSRGHSDFLGSSSYQHRRTPELVLQKNHASVRITFRPPGAESGFSGFVCAAASLGCSKWLSEGITKDWERVGGLHLGQDPTRDR